jgi:hypothetical protein
MTAAKARGNPNWGKVSSTPAPVVPTSFEGIVNKLGLKPSEFVHSAQLKDWVRKNRNSKFVPQDLLEAWEFEVDAGF